MKHLLINLSTHLLALPRTVKRLVVLLMDVSLCTLAVWLAYYLRLGEWVALSGNALLAVAASIGIALPLFIISGLYRAIFRYSGLPALLTVARAIGIYGLIYAAIFTAVGISGVPRTVGILQPVLLLLMVGGSRTLARIWLGDQYQDILRQAAQRKVLIYGAGTAGRQLAAAVMSGHDMRVAGFLDDNPALHGSVLNGLPIHHPAALPRLVANLGISDVLMALPSVNRKRRNEILSGIHGTHVAIRILPSVTELAQGKVSIADLREPDIDDLLGRDPVRPNPFLLAQNIAGKVVLVTGAGGSIGSELCRQILDVGPAVLLLIEQNEFSLYTIHQELEEKPTSSKARLVPLLTSVQNEGRLREIMSAWRPDTVYHAAAYKHVPLVEHNSVEGIRNNVLGTLKTARIASENGVSLFVLISTDKAVRPTSIMGASKRLAEMILQALAHSRADTLFTMVRFGNVLDSSGSVVPRFRQQIREGGPITLTHPDITRYFMTIPEAVQLVIQAGALANGGDVFVLDMGQPVKIMDLAHQMTTLSGLTIKDKDHPEGDIEIEITGLRPGEKLYEELLIGDNPGPTSHPKIMKAHENFLPWPELTQQLQMLEGALRISDVRAARLILERLVPDYTPDEGIVDWVYLETR
ncbi:MAG: polysaccharide biosynthesis protein [Burkholderiaceae bacterium]|jgi:FlaA1/EpsC-like NDP-sugar epimerase|nr:polysaccharide biosynthesis protein [Burkholderiaceae bacterium]